MSRRTILRSSHSKLLTLEKYLNAEIMCTSPGFKVSSSATANIAIMSSDKHSGKKFLSCKNRDKVLSYNLLKQSKADYL